jgi:hypothetical protein
MRRPASSRNNPVLGLAILRFISEKQIIYMYFDLWKNALLKPKQTFKKEKSKKDLGKSTKSVLAAGIIAGIIAGLASLDAALFLINIVAYPIAATLSFLISSGIYYLFARLFGGKGSYAAQSHLISLYLAPLFIVTTILLLVPAIGTWLNLAVAIYSLYLLTLVLKEIHGFTTTRAVLTWLIPLMIIFVISIVLAAVAYAYFASVLGPMVSDSIYQI